MPAGRPSDYTPELAERICYLLADGNSLVSICQSEDMPSTVTVYDWLDKRPEFLTSYKRARELQAHTIADRAVEMATKGARAIIDPNVAAVQLKAIQWSAKVLAPKVYGDKTNLNIGGQEDAPPVKAEQVIRWER